MTSIVWFNLSTYPLVHAVNVSDSKDVSDQDTNSDVMECVIYYKTASVEVLLMLQSIQSLYCILKLCLDI